MSKVPVKRGSVKARSSFFENLNAPNGQGASGSGRDSNEGSPEKVAAKPKWMQDLARRTDAHSNVVDKQLKSKLRVRKMITDGKKPRELPPRDDGPTESPELAAILQRRRQKAEAEAQGES